MPFDISPTAFFTKGHCKNRHPAIHTAAVSVVITQLLLYITDCNIRERERERSRLTGAGQSLYARIIYSKPHYNI